MTRRGGGAGPFRRRHCLSAVSSSLCILSGQFSSRSSFTVLVPGSQRCGAGWDLRNAFPATARMLPSPTTTPSDPNSCPVARLSSRVSPCSLIPRRKAFFTRRFGFNVRSRGGVSDRRRTLLPHPPCSSASYHPLSRLFQLFTTAPSPPRTVLLRSDFVIGKAVRRRWCCTYRRDLGPGKPPFPHLITVTGLATWLFVFVRDGSDFFPGKAAVCRRWCCADHVPFEQSVLAHKSFSVERLEFRYMVSLHLGFKEKRLWNVSGPQILLPAIYLCLVKLHRPLQDSPTLVVLIARRGHVLIQLEINRQVNLCFSLEFEMPRVRLGFTNHRLFRYSYCPGSVYPVVSNSGNLKALPSMFGICLPVKATEFRLRLPRDCDQCSYFVARSFYHLWYGITVGPRSLWSSFVDMLSPSYGSPSSEGSDLWSLSPLKKTFSLLARRLGLTMVFVLKTRLSKSLIILSIFGCFNCFAICYGCIKPFACVVSDYVYTFVIV